MVVHQPNVGSGLLVVGRVVVQSQHLLPIDEHPGLVEQSGASEAEAVPAGRLPGAVEVGLLVVAEDLALAPAGDVALLVDRAAVILPVTGQRLVAPQQPELRHSDQTWAVSPAFRKRETFNTSKNKTSYNLILLLLSYSDF